MCKPFIAVFGIWLSNTTEKIENSVFPWCFSPGPNPASPQKDVCFKDHTDVSNIRWGVELLGSLGLSQRGVEVSATCQPSQLPLPSKITAATLFGRDTGEGDEH